MGEEGAASTGAIGSIGYFQLCYKEGTAAFQHCGPSCRLCHRCHAVHLMGEGLGTPWHGARSCVSASLHVGEILGKVLDGGNAEMLDLGASLPQGSMH